MSLTLLQLVDFSKFLVGSSSERTETANAILHAFRTAGFVYLKNHPISPETVANTFDLSAKFFAQPLEEKTQLSLTSPEENRGYLRQGREKLVRPADYDASDSERTPDGVKELKASFEIGRENHETFKNHWPEDKGEVAGFKAGMLSFWEQCTSLHMQMMRAIAMGLGLEETYFDGFVDVGDNNLRLLHYPAVKASVFKARTGQVRAGEHAVSWERLLI